MAKSQKKRKSEEAGDSPASDNEDAISDIKALLATLPKDRLVELLEAAAKRHSEIQTDMRQMVDEDSLARKIFVRGLSWETKDEALIKAFSKYGEVEEAVVVSDRKTQKGRGYGFVTFAHVESVLRAMREPSVTVDGRTVFCHLSTQGSDLTKHNAEEAVTHQKIYVSNLPQDITFDKLHKFFSQYGVITDGPFGFDRSGKTRGYSVIVYETLDGAKKALEEPVKDLDGVKLRCKLAEAGTKKKEASVGVTNPQPASLQPALSSLGAGVLGGYGLSLDSSALQSGLALNQGLASSYANLSGLGLGGSLNPSLYALRSSLDPSLLSNLYPASSDSAARGLGSGLGYGPYQPGGSAGLGPLGAQSQGLAPYPAHLAAYARLTAASLYDSGLSGMSQAGAMSGSGLVSSFSGSGVSPFSTSNVGASSADRARSTGAYGSLGSYQNIRGRREKGTPHL